MRNLEGRLGCLLEGDPYLAPFSDSIRRRLEHIEETEQRLTQSKMSLADYASGHNYYGLHFGCDEWIFREWAPNARAIYLIGDLSGWKARREFAMDRISDNGVWEIRLAADRLAHSDLYRLRVCWPGGEGKN